MYIPSHFSLDRRGAEELVSGHGAADLITATDRGLMATLVPFVYDRGTGEQGSLLGHIARANPQWRERSIGEALVVVRGPDAYVSPSWYSSIAEHHKAVPTWNYVMAHVYGNLVIHDDPAWVEALVRRLTEKHETARSHPWSVDDAPAEFIQSQLRAIVGVEVEITRVEAKAKLSQNRPAQDLDGIVDGLLADGEIPTAQAVARLRK